MQKINYFLSLLLVVSFYLPAAESTPPAGALPAGTAAESTPAAGTPPAGAPADSGAPAAADNMASASQEQIVRALQDDISFERKKRQLSNELALEKLRAELQKVRSESAPPAPAAPQVLSPPPEEHDAPVVHSEPPSVLFVSQVAGVSRVGVSIGGQLRFVSRHEIFTVSGKKYRLVTAKNNRLVAKETE